LETSLGTGIEIGYGVNILVLQWVGVGLATVFTAGVTWFVMLGLAGEGEGTEQVQDGQYMSGAVQP